MTGEARPSRLAALALPALALAALGCQGPLDARSLDRICARDLPGGPACEISGVASFQSGVTRDTRGFRLQDGALFLHLAAIPDLHAGPFDLEVLAVAAQPKTPLDVALTWGSCGAACPAGPPPASTVIPIDYAWTRVLSGLRGPDAGVVIPYDAHLSFFGVETDVADLRLVLAP